MLIFGRRNWRFRLWAGVRPPTVRITAKGASRVRWRMSPEQAEGKPIDAPTDLFSPAMLYEMATGQRPFTGDTSISILSSIIRDTPAAVTDLNPALPRDLGRIIRRALAKDAERRYQTAKDLRNDLEELNASLASGDVPAALVAVSGSTAAVFPNAASAKAPASSDSQMAVALLKRQSGRRCGGARVRDRGSDVLPLVATRATDVDFSGGGTHLDPGSSDHAIDDERERCASRQPHLTVVRCASSATATATASGFVRPRSTATSGSFNPSRVNDCLVSP